MLFNYLLNEQVLTTTVSGEPGEPLHTYILVFFITLCLTVFTFKLVHINVY